MQQTHLNIMQFISEAELSFRVDEWKIGETFVWPLVRILVASELFAFADFKTENQISANQKSSHRIKQIVKSFFWSIISGFIDRKHNANANGNFDVLFLVCSTTRFFKVDGEWYNPYSDSFIKYLHDNGLSSLVLESTGDCEYRIPRFRESVFIQNRLFLLASLSLVKAIVCKPKKEVLPGFSEFIALLQERFGYGRFTLSTLRRRSFQVDLYQAYFERILNRTKPFLTINDGYYSLETMALSQACRKLSIPSVEIQHGVQGENHFAYRRWERIPEKGYPMLPTIFWCWGEEEFKNFKSWTQKHSEWHRPVIGGNPCLRVFSKDGADLVDTFNRRVKIVRSDGHSSLNIIFTLQAFYELPGFLLEAMQQSPSSWIWWIRVHPQYWETREHIRKLLKARNLTNYLIEEASDFPLGALLNHMDVHITEFSSSVLEADATGVPSIVINQKGAVLYQEKIAAGIVQEAYTAQAVLDAVVSQASKTPFLRSTKASSASIFEMSVKNVILGGCLQGAGSAQ